MPDGPGDPDTEPTGPRVDLFVVFCVLAMYAIVFLDAVMRPT